MLKWFAVVTTAVLLLTASGKPNDTEFSFVYEASSILGGDHPARDFYEKGAPLSAYLSAAMQFITGYRVIGEMLLQWSLIVTGVVIAFRLGLRFSRSRAAMLAVFPLVMLVLAQTPTYHYSKLLCFPVAISFAWSYLERPTTARALWLGCWTGISFLFRHDYVIPVAFCSALAIMLAPLVHPIRRPHWNIVSCCLASATAATVVVTPWAVVVHTGEGLLAYAQARSARYESAGNPYSTLLRMNPFRELRPTSLPAATPGVVAFKWPSDVTESRQQVLEREYGLHFLHERDPQGRFRYQVPNVYDMRLLALEPSIRDGYGFDWERLDAARRKLPSALNATIWLEQMAIVAALGMVISGLIRGARQWSASRLLPLASVQLILAGTVLAIIDAMLFREPSYVVIVAPVTAALSAHFLVGSTATRLLTTMLVALSLFAAAVSARGIPLFRQSFTESAEAASSAIATLTASPPDADDPLYVYLRECTATSDRLMVGGTTPFYVNYYTRRRIAGGHVYWHTGWRSDPAREAESLALLQHQSVPFIVWTSDSALEDLRRYPRIREYVAENYLELDGTGGRLLVEKRRHITREYGPDHRPCFH